MTDAQLQILQSKLTLRAAFRDADTERLQEMLVAARTLEMPYADSRRYCASRLYGEQGGDRSRLGDSSQCNGADAFRSRKRGRYLWTRQFWEDSAGFVGLMVFVYLLTRLQG